MGEQLDAIKALPTADGLAEILVPGEPEHRTLAERSCTGIPIPPGTAVKLRRAAMRYGLNLPGGL